RRSPSFAIGTALAFALGIGATGTMFNVIDHLLFRPPPGIRQPEQIYTVRPATHAAISYPEALALREGVHEAARLAAETEPWALPFGDGAIATSVNASFVDGQYFPTLGVRPSHGRLISIADADAVNPMNVAVLSYGFWQRTFGGDIGVLGHVVRVGTERVQIVGIAERGFNGPDQRPRDLWLPLPLASSLTFLGGRWKTTEVSWLQPVARLSSGMTAEQFAAAVTQFHREHQLSIGVGHDSGGMEVHSVLPARRDHLSPEARIAVLLGAISLVLVVAACANATTLMLARAFRRRSEIATRLALGMSRARLASHVILESICLALAGGCIAVGVTIIGSSMMRGLLLQDFAWDTPIIDYRIVAYVAIASLIAGAVAGTAAIVPVADGISPGLIAAPAAAIRRTPGARAISILVVLQATLSTVLAVGAVLFGRSLMNVRATPVGMNVEHLVVASPEAGWVAHAPDGGAQRLDEYAVRLATIPGIERVAVSQGLPFMWYTRTPVANEAGLTPQIRPFVSAVSSSYFSVIGTRILEGRAFNGDDDRALENRVVIVARSLARSLWPQGDAIGNCLYFAVNTGQCVRVVGIAQDIRESPTEPPTAADARVYVPLGQWKIVPSNRAVIARVSGDAAAAVATVRSALIGNDPNEPLPNAWSIQSRLEPELRPWRLGASIFSAFGVVALALAACGIYSVVAYGVSQRAFEMAIRMAIGARRRDIVSLVMKQGVRLVGIGLIIGLVITFVCAPLLQSLLFEASARSPATYLQVAAVLTLAGVGASLAPALRAARMKPASSLRAQ
ncbi:MAG TPA: ABC transporter permease, partial [Vicinamibacterales bacterium]